MGSRVSKTFFRSNEWRVYIANFYFRLEGLLGVQALAQPNYLQQFVVLSHRKVLILWYLVNSTFNENSYASMRCITSKMTKQVYRKIKGHFVDL